MEPQGQRNIDLVVEVDFSLVDLEGIVVVVVVVDVEAEVVDVVEAEGEVGDVEEGDVDLQFTFIFVKSFFLCVKMPYVNYNWFYW